MSLRFSSDVLDNAILCYQLRTEEALDEVVLACLCELKELRGRLTCNDFNNGYNQALEDFYKALEKKQLDNWIDNLGYEITFADVEEVIKQLKK